MSAVTFPGHGRFKFDLGSGHLPFPRDDLSSHELWATDSSSPPPESSVGTFATTPTPLPSFPTTTILSSLLTTPSLTSPSFSQSQIPTGTNTFMTTSSYSHSSLHLTTTSSNLPFPTFVNGQLSVAGNTVCLGHGLDASVDGLIVTVALSGLIGLLLWVCYTLLRHRCPSHSLTRLSYCSPLFDPIFVKYMD